MMTRTTTTTMQMTQTSSGRPRAALLLRQAVALEQQVQQRRPAPVPSALVLCPCEAQRPEQQRAAAALAQRLQVAKYQARFVPVAWPRLGRSSVLTVCPSWQVRAQEQAQAQQGSALAPRPQRWRGGGRRWQSRPWQRL
jgi:hypothetical protein